MIMKKRFIIFGLFGALIFLGNCTKNDYEKANGNIIDNDPGVEFKELLILVNIKNSDSTYVISEQLDSMEIYVNGSFFGTFSSSVVDTGLISTQSVDNFDVTSQKVEYLVQARPNYSLVEANSAGDFAEIMNGKYEFLPGDYVLLLKGFQMEDNTGTLVQYYPYLYANFTILQESSTVYLGEITIEI